MDDKKLFPLLFKSLLIGWGVAIFASFFLIRPAVLTDWFALLSIVLRLGGAFLIYKATMDFIDPVNGDKKFYKAYKTGIGYAITLMYFFCAVPVAVNDFYNAEKSGLLDAIILIFNALIPAAMYVLLILSRTKIAMGFYTAKEIKEENELRKDKKKWKKKIKKEKYHREPHEVLWQEIIDPIAFALIAVVLIQHFSFQLFQIPTESMVPTFIKNDRVIVNHLAYGPYVPMTRFRLPGFDTPKTGDIVTFESPKMYIKGHEVAYPDVFTMIFQPLVYRLTFTMVDIDMKEVSNPRTGGTMKVPKERLLVKRVLAEPGDQICIVNDVVYKRTEANPEWQPMGDKNFGKNDIYWDTHALVDGFPLNPQVGAIKDAVGSQLALYSYQDVASEYEAAKQAFIESVSRTNAAVEIITRSADFLGDVDYFSSSFYKAVAMYYNMNAYDNPSIEEDYKQHMDVLPRLVYGKLLSRLAEYLSALSVNELEANLRTPDAVNMDDPYTEYTKKLNLLYKTRLLEFYTYVLKSPDDLLFSLTNASSRPDFCIDLFNLHFYVYGYDGFANASQGGQQRDINFGFFERGHLPVFPKDGFIEDNAYFVSGDNRYNSHDSRFGDMKRTVKIDPDDVGFFALEILSSWDPHAIPGEYIMGKMGVLIFPLDRFRLF